MIFSAIFRVYTQNVRPGAAFRFADPLRLFSIPPVLAYIFSLCFLRRAIPHPLHPLGCFYTRLLRFLSVVFLCSPEIALFPTILPPVSVIIEFALRLGYRAPRKPWKKTGAARARARLWTFRI